MVSDKALKEFQQIYKQTYGVELDDSTAMELAVNWLNMMSHVYRPIKKEWNDQYDQRVKNTGGDVKDNPTAGSKTNN